jgi:hypothetical protein
MKPLLHSRITMQLIDFKIDISFKKNQTSCHGHLIG